MIRRLAERTETTDEMAHGMVVIIAARWILVVAGLVLALWNPGALGELRTSIVLVLALAVANFFLHAQVLIRGVVVAPVAYIASAADIAVISLIMIVGGGFNSNPYVFFFPAILGLSVAFRTEFTFVYAAAAIVTYGLISMGTMSSSMADGATLVTQLLMLAGVAFCGNVYWRSERDRRHAIVDSRAALDHEVREQLQIHQT